MLVRDGVEYVSQLEIPLCFSLSTTMARKLFCLSRFNKDIIYDKRRKYVNKKVFEAYLVENGLWGDISEYSKLVQNCIL